MRKETKMDLECAKTNRIVLDCRKVKLILSVVLSAAISFQPNSEMLLKKLVVMYQNVILVIIFIGFIAHVIFQEFLSYKLRYEIFHIQDTEKAGILTSLLIMSVVNVLIIAGVIIMPKGWALFSNSLTNSILFFFCCLLYFYCSLCWVIEMKSVVTDIICFYDFLVTDIYDAIKERNTTTKNAGIENLKEPMQQYADFQTVSEHERKAVKKVTLRSVKAGKKSLKAAWSKDSKASGYEVQYSAKKNFKEAKKINIKKNKTLTATAKKLSSKKTYYVRVRAYKTVGKNKIYGAYSNVRKVKIK